MSDCVELNERLQLRAEYYQITGRELPDHIRKLSLVLVKEALRQAREGIVFGDMKPPQVADDSSLMDWDRQDMKNGNAYGS